MTRQDWMTALRQDIGYGLRMLRRSPGFTLVAVATLALGIGANSAIFGVVNGVLLNSLPFRDADRLYEVNTVYPDGARYSFSAPDFMSMREENRAFERVEAYTDAVLVLSGVGEPREVSGARISDGLFDMLGLRVVLGRGFRPEEHEPGRNDVVVLDHGFWERELGGNPAVLGRALSLGGAPYRVVGVLA
ncbi:MAG: ABC transporter permease, partial [Longimicrobiales bacterium]